MNKIKTIFTHDGIELGLDKDKNLYWNGEKVLTKKKLVFEWWVNLSIILASLGTVIISIYTVFSYYYK